MFCECDEMKKVTRENNQESVTFVTFLYMYSVIQFITCFVM